MDELDTDICIIGGGPAGASAALRLRALGYRVCVLERRVFPRRTAGESLTPSSAIDWSGCSGGLGRRFGGLGVRRRLRRGGARIIAWIAVNSTRVFWRPRGLGEFWYFSRLVHCTRRGPRAGGEFWSIRRSR
ncbi:MAG: FAD-dependent oxidoreductase [Polyangiaceae bacterium]|nr:FAD-dependent oxidoreductase [Polyangiaceae bacterium]